MRDPRQSWFGETILGPGGVIAQPQPTTEAELSAILRDPGRFPSPVRPVGSGHSMTPCIAAASPEGAERWGTLVDMSRMKRLRDGQPMRIDKRGNDTFVTLPAGLTFIEAANMLPSDKQFRVNTELGSLNIGAAACGATKDSSFPGEPGQVCSDVVGMRLVLPNGEAKDFTEADPEFKALRCSYGLFGIATEVTFRVFSFEFISLKHEKIRPAEFAEKSAQWLRDGNAVFLYIFPFVDRIVAELRSRPCHESGPPEGEVRLKARNFFWDRGLLELNEAAAGNRVLQNVFDKLLAEALVSVFKLCRISPAGQIVDFEKDKPKHKFTFSMWAFPEAAFAPILQEYLALCDRHKEKGKQTFRSVLPHVSYHINGDQSSMLSYSFDGPVWTLDPICAEPKRPGDRENWEAFLRDFNAMCSSHGGKPLFNQTPLLDRALAKRAFGTTLAEYEAKRRAFDPTNRMLNGYFADLLASIGPA